MLEKQGKVVLTDEDLEQYNKGQVSSRIQETWGLSLADLEEIIASRSYIIIKTKDV
jgi:hypothetical protein